MRKDFVLAALGGVSKTAAALHLAPASVSNWGEELPDSAVGRIAKMRPELLQKWWKEEREGERRSGVPRRHSVGRRSSDG